VAVINLNTLDDLAGLCESADVECKLAAGPDGKGRLPREFYAIADLQLSGAMKINLIVAIGLILLVLLTLIASYELT
jgi:hypothetical protein